jgi:hypothetical protein
MPKIALDAIKGRVLKALRAYSPGEQILCEYPFICSADYPGQYETFPPNIFPNHLQDSAEILMTYDGIEAIDTARNLLFLIEFKLGNIKYPLEYEPELLNDLMTVNMPEYLSVISKIRVEYPNIFSTTLSTDVIAHLLGILNTNQLEVISDEYCGSGLFLKTAVLEHSCAFNSTYYTDDFKLFLVATKNIACGESFTIDYGNNYNRPALERQESLFKSYGFKCSCESCTGPDFHRSFVCALCKRGVVFAYEWRCKQCLHIFGLQNIEKYLKMESDLIETGSCAYDSVSEIHCVIENSVLSKYHYVFFWAYSDLAERLNYKALSIAEVDKGTKRAITRQALLAMRSAMILLNSVLPEYHHERIIQFDRLGQLAVAANDKKRAKFAFMQAYLQSYVIHGTLHKATSSLYHLYLNVPNTVSELIRVYSSNDM